MADVLINADLSQAELRCMALFSNDEWMIAALQEGQGDFFDTHLMPIAFPWIIDRYGTVEKYKLASPIEHKENRTKVKAVQYGLAFGREAVAIGKELKMPTADAKQIIKNYLGTATNFANWREDVKEAAINPAKRDLLVNPFGRRYQSEIVTQANYRKVQREALSFLPQSTSSDICLTTGIRIFDELEKNGYRIFNIVHDALMIQGPADRADLIGQYVTQELRETGRMVFGDRVPFLAEYSIGRNWAELD